MHVMFIPSWYSNSKNKVHGSFFKEQALALQKEDVKISIAYNEIYPMTMLGKVNEKKGISFEKEDNLNTYRYRGYNYFPRNPLMFGLFNRRMDKLYNRIVKEQGKVDIIHGNSSLWGGIAAAYLSEKYNIPLVITEHSSLSRAKYMKPCYEKYVRNSYLKAAALITVGSGLKKELVEFTSRKDIIIIPNIVNEDMFKPTKVQSKYNFSFFSLGYLEGNKGMKELISSFTKVFKKQDVHLVIGGDGSERKELEALVERFSMKDQIHFKGALSREEVAMEMNSCNVFVLASPYETFGVVYIEALFCGKPVIGLYNGGANDIINNKNGIIVEKDREDLLSQALLKIKSNISSYNSKNIISMCKDKYSSEVVAKKILSLYNEIA